MCSLSSNFFMATQWPVDLSSNTVTFNLTSLKPLAVPDIQMTISILNPGTIVNLYWTYLYPAIAG
jgi:hypothetical protein